MGGGGGGGVHVRVGFDKLAVRSIPVDWIVHTCLLVSEEGHAVGQRSEASNPF